MSRFLSGSLAVLLWLGTIVLGIVEIISVRDALLSFYAWIISRGGAQPEQLQTGYWSAVLVGEVIIVLLALVLVGFTVITGEYHTKHHGTRRSWRLFAWTLGIQLLIFLVTYPFV